MKKMDPSGNFFAYEQYGEPKKRMRKVIRYKLRVSLRVLSWHRCLAVEYREQFHTLPIDNSIMGVALNLYPTTLLFGVIQAFVGRELVHCEVADSCDICKYMTFF